MAVVASITGSGGVELSGSATTTFRPARGGALAGIVVEVDWDGDGDFDTDEEKITAYLLTGDGDTGRDFPSQLSGRAGPGRLKLRVLNTDDRFSFFNNASPLNQDGRSLAVGRLIRIRTAESTPLDPQLLSEDSFVRPDGLLGAAETGQAWAPATTDQWAIADGQATATDRDNTIHDDAVLDTGAGPVLYAQVRLGPLYDNNRAGLVIRRADANNKLTALLAPGGGGLTLIETVAGVDTILGTWSGVTTALHPWPGITVGLGTSGDGSTVTAYLCGVPVIEATHDVVGGDGIAGLAYDWEAQSPPTFADFRVWTDIARSWEGAIWTGLVADVKPAAPVDGLKTAQISAEGRLIGLSDPEVSPALPAFGAPTGILIGDILARAGQLDPPGSIALGDVSTGAVTLADGKALAVARALEETELGLLYEQAEGPIGYQARSHRAADVPPVAWLSDTTGGWAFTDVELLDRRRDIVNRVTAGIAPAAPAVVGVATRSNSTGIGVANHVDVLMPSLTAGNLVLVVIASTVATTGVGWHVPIWWLSLRQFPGTDDDDSIRTRVYATTAPGTPGTASSLGGQTVRFYTNSGSLGGAWIAHVFEIRNWFGASQGITASEWAEGNTPPPLAHGWGRTPVLLLAINAGLTSLIGGAVNAGTLAWPDGYNQQSPTTVNGATNGFDVGLHTVNLTAVAEGDAPSAFGGLEGYALLESGLLAIRGFNGPHLALPTLANPNQFQESPGRSVTVDDIPSQRAVRTVRARPRPATLFASEDDARAYAETILVTFATDRPVVKVTILAHASASLRRLAIRRRVGDRIHLTANGPTGQGIDGGYWIEHIAHRFDEAGTKWTVTWQLAPA